jgi:predicted branched-subunit amino acid permease
MEGIRGTFVAALPAAAAIAVFGIIYGSLAEPELGATKTVVSSILIFSGSVQFTLAALLATGAGTAAIVLGAATLNLRNVVLGAMLRPRVREGPLRRAGIAWFLTDEAAGLAVATRGNASMILIVAGAMFYVAWQLGTVLGVLGASVDSLREAAAAVFPVLFVGLAAVTCTSRSNAVRALIAGIAAGFASWLWPGSQGVAAVVAAIAVSIPGGDG